MAQEPPAPLCTREEPSPRASASWAGEVIISAMCSWMRELRPALRMSSARPGRAKASRPYYTADVAVIRDPPLDLDSTTTTALVSPAMMRLRRTKLRATGEVSVG